MNELLDDNDDGIRDEDFTTKYFRIIVDGVLDPTLFPTKRGAETYALDLLADNKKCARVFESVSMITAEKGFILQEVWK